MLQPACEVVAVRAIHLLYWQKSPEHYLFQRNPWLVLSCPAVLTAPCWRVAHTCEFSFSCCKSHEVSSRSREKGTAMVHLHLWTGDLKHLPWQSVCGTLTLFVSVHHFPSEEKWMTNLPCLCWLGEKYKNLSKCGLDKHLKSTEAKLGSETV